MAKRDADSLENRLKDQNAGTAGQSALEAGIYSTDPATGASERIPSNAEEDRKQAKKRKK